MTVEYGFQGTHITNVAAVLAQCPSWQTVCGVATEAEASGYIHLVDVQPEPDAPYAVVYPGTRLLPPSIPERAGVQRHGGCCSCYRRPARDKRQSFSRLTRLSPILCGDTGARARWLRNHA